MPFNPDEIADWYNEHTKTFVKGGDDIIQSMRPDDTTELMQYLMRSIPIQDGMHILDAGCGIGGPAIYFASHADVQIEALTISPVEADAASARVSEARLGKLITIRVGDYHKLNELYEPASFDGILFLESLGHAHAPHTVLNAAAKVLKPGGFIYIKDFVRRISQDPEEQRQIDVAVSILNTHYRYNALSLHGILENAANAGFTFEHMEPPSFTPSQRYKGAFEEGFGENIQVSNPIVWLEIKLSHKAID